MTSMHTIQISTNKLYKIFASTLSQLRAVGMLDTSVSRKESRKRRGNGESKTDESHRELIGLYAVESKILIVDRLPGVSQNSSLYALLLLQKK